MQLDSSTGAFTYTRASGASGTVVITFTASDGIKTSNVATLYIDGYQLKTDPTNGDTYIQYSQFPWAGGNIGYISGGEYDMVQSGKLQVDAPGVLADAYPADQNSGNPSVSSIIEQPQHGSLSMTNSTGAFTYTPNPDYSGLDWFTWQVSDGSGTGPYASAFIYVAPLNPTISVGGLKPGDPTAQIPNDQFPPDANGDPHYTTINLNAGASLPNGSTVTLSVNGDVQNDLDIYDGIPGQSGTNLLLGKDAGTDMYTWTISDTQGVPSQVYAVGLAGTNYDQITITLSVSVGTTEYGGSGGNSPGASPPAQPAIEVMNLGTGEGNSGYLAAFDGTWQVQTDPPDNVAAFFKDYSEPSKDYQRGVGNPQQHTWLGQVIWGWLGGPEAAKIVNAEFDKLVKFYEDPTKWGTPVDTIGWSRGCFESVKFVNDIAAGVPNVAAKKTVNGTVQIPNLPSYAVPIRFVGLISPVGQMGPGMKLYWPTSLPNGVKYFAEAVDGYPINVLFPESKIYPAQGTTAPQPKQFPYTHPEIGWEPDVLNYLEIQALIAGVPLG